jgi:DNA-binding Lrp family transcriptional regulator
VFIDNKLVFFNSREEREHYVIELYKQGRSIRDIAQEVHMSFSDIGAIIRKITGDNRSKGQAVEPSKETQAYKLFMQAKKPVEVAIELNLGSKEVDRLYREYWHLQGLYKLNLAYDEIKDYLPSFLKLYRLMRQEEMQEEDIEHALKYAKELPSLENRVQQTRKELENIENKRNNSNAESFILEKQLNKLKGDLELYQSSLHNKREEMAYLNNEIAKIQSLIDKIKNNEDYRIITEVAKEEVDSILENKKVILSLAVISVVGALKNDPNTKLLLGGSKEETSFTLIDDYYNSLSSDPRILQMVEEIHDKMSSICTQNTVTWAPIKFQQDPLD